MGKWTPLAFIKEITWIQPSYGNEDLEKFKMGRVLPCTHNLCLAFASSEMRIAASSLQLQLMFKSFRGLAILRKMETGENLGNLLFGIQCCGFFPSKWGEHKHKHGLIGKHQKPSSAPTIGLGNWAPLLWHLASLITFPLFPSTHNSTMRNWGTSAPVSLNVRLGVRTTQQDLSFQSWDRILREFTRTSKWDFSEQEHREYFLGSSTWMGWRHY